MLSEDSETEDINTLTINEHYAKAFEYRKEREELAKLKEKYGSDVEEDDFDEEDSEEGESEDEDGEELTPAVDAAILRTLARIRRKDPSIYEQGKGIFEEEHEKTGTTAPSTRVQKDKSKPLTMRQHALASAMKLESRSPSPEPLTHVAEQAALRKETIAAFHTAADAQESKEDLLIPREKTKDELEREEEEYRAFLEREVGEDLKDIVEIEGLEESSPVKLEDDDAVGTGKKKKKSKKTDGEEKSKQEKDQEFLMNYILNRGWIDRSTRRLPTYSEITRSKDGKGKAPAQADDLKEEPAASGSEVEETGPADLDDEEFDEVADRFESSYNFRFEEPDATTIARYPRNLTSLVRRQDTTRKEARENRKARKEEELLKKKEEVKRLKALKVKELREKLERIGKEGGRNLESMALQELDLEGDWDPDAHDKQMADLYDDDEAADEKPQWDDDIDIGDIVSEDDLEENLGKKSKKKKKKKKDRGATEDAAGVDVDEMDAEVVADEEEWDGTEEMRKRKLDEYMDELYGMEFNDMVGDIPTRFKYTTVAPQTFALSPEEILMATDAELNSYIGIKKYAPYRKEGKGKQWDNTRVARLKELKEKLSQRGVASVREDTAGERPKKRKGKKERMRERVAAVPPAGEDYEVEVGQEQSEPHEQSVDGVSVGNLEGPPKKKRRRHRKPDRVNS